MVDLVAPLPTPALRGIITVTDASRIRIQQDFSTQTAAIVTAQVFAAETTALAAPTLIGSATAVTATTRRTTAQHGIIIALAVCKIKTLLDSPIRIANTVTQQAFAMAHTQNHLVRRVSWTMVKIAITLLTIVPSGIMIATGAKQIWTQQVRSTPTANIVRRLVFVAAPFHSQAALHHTIGSVTATAATIHLWTVAAFHRQAGLLMQIAANAFCTLTQPVLPPPRANIAPAPEHVAAHIQDQVAMELITTVG
jgi:hypothetical protein